MEIRPISELNPGEKFIWADDYTREYMQTGNQETDRKNLDVLQVVEFKPWVSFLFQRETDGSEESLYFNEDCRAIVVSRTHRICSFDVKCDSCGERYGDHKGNICMSPELNGVNAFFVPNEDDLRRIYPGEFDERKDDFFASLGL